MKQSAYIKKYGSWANVPQDIKDKILSRPEMTELQRLAQKENFALFILKGIQGNLVHLMDVPGVGTINIEKIRMYAAQAEKNIKLRQTYRKNAKNLDKKGK